MRNLMRNLMRKISGFVIFAMILCVALVIFVKQNAPKYAPFAESNAESGAESCHFKHSEKSQNLAESSVESCHFKHSEKSKNTAESSVDLFKSNKKSQNIKSQNLTRGGAEHKIKSKISPSLAKNKPQSFPHPCGGGLRGWVDSAFAESKLTSSLRESRSDSWQSTNLKTSNRLPRFAKGKSRNDKIEEDSANRVKIVESNTQITHPLAPSAREGEENANTLILPNAESSAHSSSLLDLGEKIMAVYFAGSREGASDVKIMAHFIDKQTLQSSPQRAILDAKTLSMMAQKFIKKLGNPVIFRDKNGRIHLFVVGVSLGGWATSKIYHLQFGENLQTLEFRSELKLGLLANFSHLVRTPPVKLKNGGFMLPIYYELGAKYALVAFFDENANFTHAKRINALKNQLQPTIIALDSRKCLAFFRNHKAHKNASFLQECDDFGAKWSAPSATNLMGWDDSPVLVSYKNPQNIRRILLLYNDGKMLENGEWQGNSRASLGLYLLSDFAKFSHLQNIDKTEQSYPHEVSYPSALIDKNYLFIAYTHNRKNIKIKRINLADLERKISDFAILDSAKDNKNAESTTILQNLNAEFTTISSLRGARSEVSATKQFAEFANKAKQPSKLNCHFERSEKSLFRFCDSAIKSPFFRLDSLSFSQKGCTPPLPAPPTRQKLTLFAFRGRASLFPLLAKNRRLHYCNLESDFLHHEAGEFWVLTHESFLKFTISRALGVKND